MKIKRIVIAICDLVLYLITYFVLQYVCAGVLILCGKDLGTVTALASAVSNLLSIALFFLIKWADWKDAIRQISWHTALLVALLALSMLIPAQLLEDWMQIEMPDYMDKVLNSVIQTPWGYLALGILAPIGEEVLFRGAILKRTWAALQPWNNHGTILKQSDKWLAIFVSALLFALVHGNLAQGVHAFLVGILLGWLYTKTGSLLPGIILHWVNNTAAWGLVKMFPSNPDIKLLELFHGNAVLMYVSGAISLAIMIAIIYFLQKKSTFRVTFRPYHSSSCCQ